MFLVNRPLPLPFEGLEAYKNRLGKANYYDDRNWLSSLVPIKPEQRMNLLSSEQVFVKLAELTLLDVDTLIAMTLHRFVPYFYAPEDIPKLPHLSERFPVPLWEVNRRKFIYDVIGDQDKICPLCWQEYHTHFLPWMLRPVTTCLIHQTVLIDTCTQCGTILQVGAKTCPTCETDKDSLQPIYIEDPLEITYTEVVWKLIGCGNTQSDFPMPTINIPGQGEITSPQFFQFLWKMGTLLSARDKENPYFKTVRSQLNTGKHGLLLISKAQTIRCIMIAAFQVLSNWPTAWFSALERIAWYENYQKASNTTSSLANYTLPHKLKKLFKEPEWAWIFEAFVRWVEGNASAGHDAVLWAPFLERLPYKNLVSKSPLKNKSALCREFRIARGKVDQALKHDFISSITTEDIAKRPMKIKELFSAEEIAKLQEEIASFMSLTEAVEYVGVAGKQQLTALNEKGLLPERKINVTRSTAEVYNKEELECALHNLTSNLPQRSLTSETVDGLSFQQGIRLLSLSGIEMADALAAVRDRKLEAFYDSSEKGLRGLWFYKQAIDEFSLAYLHPDENSVCSARYVATTLGCNYKTLRNLFNAQVLVPVIGNLDQDEVSWKYGPDDVVRFQAEYVTRNEATEIIGVARPTLVRWIKAGWISAVTGPIVDGSRRFRINKHLLVEWANQWFSTKQVLQFLGVSQDQLNQWRKQGRITPIKEMGPLWYRRDDVIHLKQKIENEEKRATH